MDFFEKLILSRELSFGNGEIVMLGSRMVLFDADLFVDYGLRINNSPEKILDFYTSAKVTFRDSIAKAIGIKYKFSFNDYFKWMTDIANLAGWGRLRWENLIEEMKTGVVVVENSPIAISLKGKVNNPVDHVIRGFIAGGASASLRGDVDVVEEECVANGAQFCRFIFKPSDKFDYSNPEVVRQIGNPKK